MGSCIACLSGGMWLVSWLTNCIDDVNRIVKSSVVVFLFLSCCLGIASLNFCSFAPFSFFFSLTGKEFIIKQLKTRRTRIQSSRMQNFVFKIVREYGKYGKSTNEKRKPLFRAGFIYLMRIFIASLVPGGSNAFECLLPSIKRAPEFKRLVWKYFFYFLE